MTDQAARVLAYLKRWGPDGDRNISRALRIPAPSVRRSIQELIQEGHNITFASHLGLYSYSTRAATYQEATHE